jgi:hypothetical protein
MQLPGSIRITATMLDQSVLLPYLLLLFAIIGRRTLTAEELIALLRQRMRQHSLVHGSRRDYVVTILQQQPP